MNDKKAKSLVTEAFTLIQTLKDITELEAFLADKIKISFNIDLYPKIDFSISEGEIEDLRNQMIINKEDQFSPTLSCHLKDPLTKLLYSIVWKNGDLKKVSHIIEGIKSKPGTEEVKEDGLVFYQFGKFLSYKGQEPIIDQHILRAFVISQTEDEKEISNWRKKSVLKKDDRKYIDEYRQWSSNLKRKLQIPNLIYHLDKFLFCLGKKIKVSKRDK